jgi:rhodanese-related sulfurtransferase
MRSSIGDARILEKRVPKSSAKYQGAVSRLDTGVNMRKIMMDYEGTSGPSRPPRGAAHRSSRARAAGVAPDARPARVAAAPTRRADARLKVTDEYFQRLKPTTLAALIAELEAADESVYELGADAAADCRSACGGASRVGGSPGTPSVAGSTRSLAARSVVSHAQNASPSVRDAEGAQHMLLLLDARPPEAFEAWRVRGAASYPPQQLIHASNPLPKDIYYYKGERDGSKLVVLYDDDGKSHAVAAANLLTQKGVDNAYVLKGGLREFAPRFPHLLAGNVPPLPPPPTPSVVGLANLRGGVPGTAGSRPGSTASSVRGGGGGRPTSTGSARGGQPPPTATSVGAQFSQLSGLGGKWK